MKLVSLFSLSLLIGLASRAELRAASSPVSSAGNASRAGAATIIVLDASGSMRGRIEGQTKIDIAKHAVRELVESLPDDARLGLVVYSHRRSNDCNDIELLIAPAAKLDKAAFLAAVEKITPKGPTPLSASLQFAAEALDYTKSPANIILISDGVETCGKDPCATVQALKQRGPQLVIHAVAFDLSANDAKAFECVAALSGGRFLQARNAATLKDALTVVAAETKAAAPAPPAEVITTATLKAPPTVTAGASFSVTWTGPNNAGDFISIAPKGAAAPTAGNYTYTQRGNPLELTAPIEIGDAEVRYVTARTHTILARADIKVTPAQVTLAAADEATAGAAVSVTWTGPNNNGDYITIVAKGADDADYGNYMNTQAGSPLTVAAPVDAGDAEIRYMSGQGAKVLARRALKVTAASATLSADDEVTAGSDVSVSWTGPNNRGDFITIVAKDALDAQTGASMNTQAGSPLKVTAPIDAGDFEIRYISGQGHRVLARRAVKTIAASATLDAADEITAGSALEVSWTGPNNRSDYITITPKGAPDNRAGSSSVGTHAGSPLKITTPIETGEFEIRYVSGQGARVLARRPVRTIAAEVTLSAPDEAIGSSQVSIEWQGPGNNGDYITIVPRATADGKSGRYANISSGSPVKVVAPLDAGDAEIRYMSGQGAKVLGRRSIRIVAAKITMSAQSSAAAGATVAIAWTGPDNAGDYITIVPKGAADGTSGKYAMTRGGSPANIGLPAAPGTCEIRYVDGATNRVLARANIESQ